MSGIKEEKTIDELKVLCECTRVADNVGVLCTVALGSKSVDRFFSDKEFEKHLYPGVYGLFYINSGYNEPVVDRQLGSSLREKNFEKARAIIQGILQFDETQSVAKNATKGIKTDVARIFVKAKNIFAMILTLSEAYEVEGKTFFEKLEALTKLPIESQKKGEFLGELYNDYQIYLEPLLLVKQVDVHTGHKVLVKEVSGTDLTFVYVLSALCAASIIYLLIRERQNGLFCYEVEKRPSKD